MGKCARLLWHSMVPTHIENKNLEHVLSHNNGVYMHIYISLSVLRNGKCLYIHISIDLILSPNGIHCQNCLSEIRCVPILNVFRSKNLKMIVGIKRM